MKKLSSHTLKEALPIIVCIMTMTVTAFLFSMRIGLKQTVWYWAPFGMLLLITPVIMMFTKYLLKSDLKIIIITSLIMTIGIFAQALTFSVESPVRKSLNIIYETAASEELMEIYPEKTEIKKIKDSADICGKFGITPENAKKMLRKAAEVTHIDLLKYMKKLETEKSRIILGGEAQPEQDIFYTYLYKDVFYGGSDEKQKANDTGENENMTGHIMPYRNDNAGYENVLTVKKAETLDEFLSTDSETSNYYQSIKYEVEQAQRREHAGSIIKYIFLGYGFAILFMMIFSIYSFNSDIVIGYIFVLQMAAMLIMKFFGKGDTATVSVYGINLLELTKLSYILITANLLGKYKDKKYFVLFPFPIIRLIIRKFIRKHKNKNYVNKLILKVNRLWIALFYNLITALMFILCSEMGTMIVLLATGIIMCIICLNKDALNAFFPKKRKWVICASVSVIVLAVTVAGGIVQVYFTYSDPDHYITDNASSEEKKGDEKAEPEAYCIFDKTSSFSDKNTLLASVLKIDQRIYAWKHADPDKDLAINYGSGSQYVQIINARRAAGWFGCPSDDKDSVSISISESDMIFCQIVHSLGVITGLIIMALYAMLIAFAYKCLCRADDTYYRTLGFLCVILLAVQTLMHIMINISLFPISGIPLMYISKGGTIQMVSLIITMMIIEISSNSLEISRKNEEMREEYIYGRKALSGKEALQLFGNIIFDAKMGIKLILSISLITVGLMWW